MADYIDFAVGTWTEGLDEGVGREVESLSRLLTQGVLDALLALAMFDQALNATGSHVQTAWDQDREWERKREEELESQDPPPAGATEYAEWRHQLSMQARRDLARAKWEAGELPGELRHRLPFIHAQTFVRALARVGRGLRELEKLDTGAAKAEIRAARGEFDRALPALKEVRDSVEHAEDRLRGRNRHGQTMTLAPIQNRMVNAPGGGVLIADALNGRNFGSTVDDGSYKEVEMSDATVEIARASVQRALDALPWMPHAYPRYVPSA